MATSIVNAKYRRNLKSQRIHHGVSSQFMVLIPGVFDWLMGIKFMAFLIIDANSKHGFTSWRF